MLRLEKSDVAFLWTPCTYIYIYIYRTVIKYFVLWNGTLNTYYDKNENLSEVTC